MADLTSTVAWTTANSTMVAAIKETTDAVIAFAKSDIVVAAAIQQNISSTVSFTTDDSTLDASITETTYVAGAWTTDNSAFASQLIYTPLLNGGGMAMSSSVSEFYIVGHTFSYPKPNADGSRPQYTIKVLSPGGTYICTLTDIKITALSWELNGPGMIEFVMAINDPLISNLKVTEREVQVWQGDTLIHWGVVVRGTVTPGQTVTFQCPGLAWYFTKRVIGTIPTNYIQNGSFEAGDDNWDVGYYGYEPTASRLPGEWVGYTSSDRSVTGGRSLYMECSEAVYYGICAGQTFFWTVDASESPKGDVWTIVVWLYIPSDKWVKGRVTSINGSPGQYSGIMVNRVDMTTITEIDIPGLGLTMVPRLIEGISLPISEGTGFDKWVRLEAPIRQPVVPGTTELIQILLGTPVGGIYYDNITLTRNQKLYYDHIEQATILTDLVNHAQHSFGKSDLRIGTNIQPTGVNKTRMYEFYNHELISDCIAEFPAAHNGMDWDIQIRPDGTRTFTSYFPQKGVSKPNRPLILSADDTNNIATLSYSEDGEATANSVMVLAEGSQAQITYTDWNTATSSGREEAMATDPTSLADGLILERVFNATPGAAINSLQAQAVRGLRKYKRPVVVPTVTTYEVLNHEVFGYIEVGDTVPISATNGWASLHGDYRIVSLSLDPNTGIVNVGINPAEIFADELDLGASPTTEDIVRNEVVYEVVSEGETYVTISNQLRQGTAYAIPFHIIISPDQIRGVNDSPAELGIGNRLALPRLHFSGGIIDTDSAVWTFRG